MQWIKGQKHNNRFSKAARQIKRAVNAKTVNSILTDEEIALLRNAGSELDVASITTFYWADSAQRHLEELWDPEIRIHREAEEVERPAAASENMVCYSIAEPEWYIGMTSGFMKKISKIDRKLRGRILDAIAQITSAPVTPVGNTIKPLTSEKKGMWRYRIGDYRLIYRPDDSSKHILLLTFSARGKAYD